VSAERDPDWFAAARADGNPEVIDVRRDAIGFSREGDGTAGDMNHLSVAELEIAALGLFSTSVRQAR
jgi:hypothetical protein